MSPPTANGVVQSTSAVPDMASKPSGSQSHSSASRLSGPLDYSGSLDSYEQFDVTGVIGREFPSLQLSEILHDDTKLRDLGVLVAQRGVVFFRNQDLELQDQKLLTQRLGELTGKPETSKLHKHVISYRTDVFPQPEPRITDDEVSVIYSESNRKYNEDADPSTTKKLSSLGWHADVTYEKVPPDYSVLKLLRPADDAGGDTIWASGYEIYDRLSLPFQRLADSLTATHSQPDFVTGAEKLGLELVSDSRGAPENTGLVFEAEHPLVRTHPVTGWKSLFGAGQQLRQGYVNEVTERENQILGDYFLQLMTHNHDLQVRFRWGKNDIAIWDNRCTFHNATYDYTGLRWGHRVVSIGEKPYFDPNSKSRRQALAQK